MRGDEPRACGLRTGSVEPRVGGPESEGMDSGGAKGDRKHPLKDEKVTNDGGRSAQETKHGASGEIPLKAISGGLWQSWNPSGGWAGPAAVFDKRLCYQDW